MDAELAEPMRQSFISFYMNALGIKFVVLLPFAALVGFVLTLLLVLRGRGAFLVPALMFAVSLPLLVGVYGVAEGIIQSIQVIMASTVTPRPSDLAAGYGMSLVAGQVGIILALPSYFAAILGMVIRSVLPNKPAQ